MRRLQKRSKSVNETLEGYSCYCENCTCGCSVACEISGNYTGDWSLDNVYDLHGERDFPIFQK